MTFVFNNLGLLYWVITRRRKIDMPHNPLKNRNHVPCVLFIYIYLFKKKVFFLLFFLFLDLLLISIIKKTTTTTRNWFNYRAKIIYFFDFDQLSFSLFSFVVA